MCAASPVIEKNAEEVKREFKRHDYSLIMEKEYEVYNKRKRIKHGVETVEYWMGITAIREYEDNIFLLLCWTFFTSNDWYNHCYWL